MPEKDEDRVAAVRRALRALLDRLAWLVAEDLHRADRGGPGDGSPVEDPGTKGP